jgi:lipoate-protein ligase A
MRWYLWHDGAHRGDENMARDAALLDLCEADGCGVVRCYGWSPATLSFGANEPALRRYDRDRIAALGLAVVRRPTGGRAVWHADELTYAVAAPADTFGSLPDTYHAIHAVIAAGLRTLGAAVDLADRTPRTDLDAGACFATPAGGEVVAGGRKVVGSAQLRRGGAFLQHGSILLGGSQDQVRAVTRGAAPAGAETTLASILGRPVTPQEAARAIATELPKAWPGSWSDGSGVAERVAGLAQRHIEQFRGETWTWRR